MKIEKKDGVYVITDFNPQQAYQIALKIEKDGLHLYMYLYRKLKDDPRIKQKKGVSIESVIQFFVEQEEKHYRYFKKLLQGLPETSQDKTDSEKLRMLDWLDLDVFPTGLSVQQLCTGIDDFSKLFDFAYTMETKAVAFYNACLACDLSSETKDVIEKIIAEEKKHQEMIEQVRKTL